MERFLWFSASAAMLALLVLLGLRALRELFGADVRLPGPAAEVAAGPDLAALPWPVLFFASLAVLWLGAFLAHAAATGGADGFFGHYWERFTRTGDAEHYLYLAESGYARHGDKVNLIVFYPLYPLLIRFAGTLLGGRYALAGVLISQVCYGFSAVVLARLARKECAHPGMALAAYWLYPFGFFCLGVFTEGVFLLLTVSGLYLLRERRWLAAGAVGVLCALTRVQGVLLLLPGAYLAWRECRKQGWQGRYLAACCPLLGFGIYLGLNKAVCGSFLAFQYYESIEPWWQTTQWLGDTVAQQWSMARAYPGLANWIYYPQMTLYFAGAALLLLGFFLRTDMPWLLYGTAYLGMCYTAGWLISGGRYMLGCLPLYLCLGRLKSSAVRGLVLLAELLVFGMMYCYFMQGQAIM